MITSCRGNSIYTKVSELIDPITGQWDLDILNSLFNSLDVARIMSIPINTQGFDDFIAWKATKNGKYSVRSGYYLQWRHQFGPTASQFARPGSSAVNPIWKLLWQMKIPSKVKKIIWRALHGIVPLKCILANRHIGMSAGCPVCNLGPEDLRHLFFQCPVAKNLWESIGISGLINDSILEDRAGSAVLEHLLKREDNHLVGMPNTGMKETIAVACWYLWWLRRWITNNESTPSIYNCKMSIFSIVANAAKATVAGGMNQTVKWTKPHVRYIKLNVDASFYVDLKKGATAAMLRDY
jgi:hypothetical protein